MDANSIEGICKQKLRLDSEAVLHSDNQRALAVAVTQLQRSYEEAAAQGGDPAVLDPVADLKLNQLEVVDSVRERQRLMQVRLGNPFPQSLQLPPPPSHYHPFPPHHPLPSQPPPPLGLMQVRLGSPHSSYVVASARSLWPPQFSTILNIAPPMPLPSFPISLPLPPPFHLLLSALAGV